MALSSCTLFFGVFMLYHIHQLGAHNPCVTKQYYTISDVRRSILNKYDGRSGDPLLCDRNFIKDDTWYRFQSLAGGKMPTKDPGFWHCGTFAPIYLNGVHPTSTNVEVNAKACVNLPFTPPKGCSVQYDIKIINCGAFFLYKLKEPRQCSLAYCAGSKEVVSCSVTGDTLPVCPGIVPTVNTLEASAKDDKEDQHEELVKLKCVWKYAGNNVDNVEFQVRWFGDEKDSKHIILKNFTGTATGEFILDFGCDMSAPFECNKVGYRLDKQVFCQIRARYISGTWSKWKSSNKIYTGIVVHPQTFEMKECGNDNKRDVIVTLRPHLPIRGKPIIIDIQSSKSQLVDSICIRGDLETLEYCQVKLTSNHSINAPLRIKLRTTCALAQTKDSEVDFEFGKRRLDTKISNPFWFDFKFPNIKIFEKKNKKRECHSVTDPHFLTFDGRPYNFYGVGTFRLYRNSYTSTEVQTRQKSCAGGFASCNCAVAIKENAFYKIYDMCNAGNANQPWWQNHQGLVIRKRHLTDSIVNGFFTKQRADGSTTVYEINLPSGVAVTIQRKKWGLSTYVKAPVHPEHLSDGLCGNNNGDPNDDFDGKSDQAFFESNRIKGESIFEYKGDKTLEDKIDSGCRQKICICQKDGVQNCTKGGNAVDHDNEVIKRCNPSVNTGYHTDSDIGLCKTRRKRDLDQDDDIDDQDEIPPFNPPNINNTFVPSWPTPKGLTKVNVTNFCNKKLRLSQAGETCGNITGVDINTIVRQCIADIQITEDFGWVIDNFATLEKTCVTNAYKNISLYKNTTDGELGLPTEILASLCPNDCSDRGTCFNSTCTCDEDYTAPDCSISLKDSPLVFGIRKSGLCDVRRRPCRNVGIYGFPLLDSENLTCHVEEYKVIDSVWTPKNSISLYPGLLVDLTEVKCSLPASPVNLRDYENNGVTAAGLKIAVSNNRINASKVSMSFITYDSVCQECNTTTGCKLKSNACLIWGHCFAQNESQPRDWCQQCLPEISRNSWRERKDNQEPIFQTSKVLYAFYGKRVRIQLRANDPENRKVQFTFEQNATVSASLTESGLFTWTPITNSSTSFIFKVQDECEAYSILNTSVVIKQCPCENGGLCQPDHLDLDGFGRFTCLCQAGYNGTLCEHDINECLTLPCNNGTCKNTKPGFFCLCDAGYTGILCETDIDECLLSPCFLGVQCHNIVNGYRCEPCPKGYSGDGVNCSRIDGRVDECIKSPQVCHRYATCIYNNRTYTCQCQNGYLGDGKTNCTDVNECNEPDVCHPHANCTNTEGSYFCRCSRGYAGDGKVNCTDIDECTRSSQVCHQHGTCTNTQGSYSCQCTMGYSGDGIVTCADINECTKDPNICHRHANCSNTEGSYSCQCTQGYSGDGTINCTDVNECINSPAICHQHANCTNTEGSYSCQCVTGYLGDGKLTCTDIDECTRSPQVCHEHGSCTNTQGSYTCQCGTGYSGDGMVNCSDIDECTKSPKVCHEDATCANTMGSYSCQCTRGYLGDGKINCTENIPPRFTTPDTVYAILNKEFRIQIKAEDPEAQNMKYFLLPNGTTKNVKLSEDGLLILTTVKETRNVSIEVEDEAGGQSILVLQIITIQCPCKHNGECYQTNSSSYPRTPTNYKCKCKAPYTGASCESRPDPCNEVPCFPGLKCSWINNEEDYTCEECPELFEGDGKSCTLKSTSEKNTQESEMTLTNQEWDDELTNKASKTYKILVSELIKEIRKVYIGYDGFSYVVINGFRRGSVIVEFKLIFTKQVDDPLKPLRKVAKTGKLGNMTVKMQNLDENSIDKDENILGLDKTIFIVVIIAVVLLLVLIGLMVYHRVKRIKTHRDAKLSKKVNPAAGDTQPKGLLFQPSADEPDLGVIQEIDLHVFHNEAALNDELKDKP